MLVSYLRTFFQQKISSTLIQLNRDKQNVNSNYWTQDNDVSSWNSTGVFVSIRKYLQAKFLVSSASCAAINSAFFIGSASFRTSLWKSSSYFTKSPNNTMKSTWKKTMVAQNCHEFVWNLKGYFKFSQTSARRWYFPAKPFYRRLSMVWKGELPGKVRIWVQSMSAHEIIFEWRNISLWHEFRTSSLIISFAFNRYFRFWIRHFTGILAEFDPFFDKCNFSEGTKMVEVWRILVVHR